MKSSCINTALVLFISLLILGCVDEKELAENFEKYKSDIMDNQNLVVLEAGYGEQLQIPGNKKIFYAGFYDYDGSFNSDTLYLRAYRQDDEDGELHKYSIPENANNSKCYGDIDLALKKIGVFAIIHVIEISKERLKYALTLPKTFLHQPSEQINN